MISPLAILLLLLGLAACEVRGRMCCKLGAGQTATGSGAPWLLYMG